MRWARSTITPHLAPIPLGAGAQRSRPGRTERCGGGGAWRGVAGRGGAGLGAPRTEMTARSHGNGLQLKHRRNRSSGRMPYITDVRQQQQQQQPHTVAGYSPSQGQCSGSGSDRLHPPTPPHAMPCRVHSISLPTPKGNFGGDAKTTVMYVICLALSDVRIRADSIRFE